MFWLFFICLVLSGVHNVQVEDDCTFDCSQVYDPVCGLYIYEENAYSLETFTNICHLRKAMCSLGTVVMKQLPNSECGIETENYRRLASFDIVGAHEVCNHTCPTYCVDNYEPACAQIWKRNSKQSELRVMINHCHIDLFSCAVGVNVTIVPLGKCFSNPSGLLFLNHIHAMRTLKLMD